MSGYAALGVGCGLAICLPALATVVTPGGPVTGVQRVRDPLAARDAADDNTTITSADPQSRP